MAEASLEKLLEEVMLLTPAERRRLRDYLDREARAEESLRRNDLARSIRGKYSHALSSSEDFALCKADEAKFRQRSADK